MKKSIIATGAASLALAAMPVVGAFAVGNSVVDQVQITIDGSCSVANNAGSTSGTANSFSATLTNGGEKNWTAGGTGDSAGGTLKVSCNSGSGWNITAIGSSDTANGSTITSMTPSTAGSTPIATGAGSDTTSGWQFQVTGTGTITTYNSYSDVPSTATKVATSNVAASQSVINTGYHVKVSLTQQADTYTGKVTYTVAEGA